VEQAPKENNMKIGDEVVARIDKTMPPFYGSVVGMTIKSFVVRAIHGPMAKRSFQCPIDLVRLATDTDRKHYATYSVDRTSEVRESFRPQTLGYPRVAPYSEPETIVESTPSQDGIAGGIQKAFKKTQE
jgi:hypothetical protein